MMKSLAIIALCIQAVTLLTVDEFLHDAFLDSSEVVRLWWMTREDGIRFRLQVKAQVERPGYMSVGISPDGGMKGADMTVALLDVDGNVKLVDAHAEGSQRPVVDDEQDVQLLASLVDGSSVQVTFDRRDSSNSQDVSVTPNKAVYVIWAYGQLDSAGKVPIYHENNRGVRLINLHWPDSTAFSPEEDLKYLDLLVPSVALPENQQTFYHCHITKLLPQRLKSHLVGSRPLIELGHEDLVDHIRVYECVVREHSRADFERYVSSQTHAQCYSPNMPADWQTCRDVLVAWAVGGGLEKLPDNVGIPLHGSNYSVTYLMVETHYNNSQLKAGLVDSSGVRLYYTERLRRHEGGLLFVGHSVLPMMLLPPGQHRFTVTGLCSSQCINRWPWPNTGITVYSVRLRTHRAGVQVKVHHISDYKEPTLVSDPAYDSNHQQTTLLASPVRVMHGEQLLVECVYDTSGRDNMTFGGLDTESEVCQALLGYYPRLSMISCLSAPDLGLMLPAIGVHRVEIEGETIPADEAGGQLQTLIDNSANNDPSSDKSEVVVWKPLPQSVQDQMQQLPEPMRNVFLQLRDIQVSSEDGWVSSSLFEYLLHLSWDKLMLQRLQNATTVSYRPQCRYRNGEVSSFDHHTVEGIQLSFDDATPKRQDNTASRSSLGFAALPHAIMLLLVHRMLFQIGCA